MTTDGRRERASALLARLAADPASQEVMLADLLDAFDVRAYGVLILVAALAGFLPTPVGAGAIAGPLAGLLGVQMLTGQRHPWLPRWIARRGIARASIGRFLERFGGLLRRLERWCRPRRVELFGALGVRVTGALLIGHAIVLALPIPLTNFPLSFVLVLAGVALLEDDGHLLLAAWALMAATIAGFVWFSETVLAAVARFVG